MRIICFLFLTFCLSPLASASYNHHDHYPTHSLVNALRTGTDTNGKPLYLCLARLFDSTQLGKTWEGYGRCNVPYGGKEYIVDQFDIPHRQLFNHTQWQGDNGESPLRIGLDSNGAPLFLCQAFFRGSRQPGKTWPGYHHCNISYAGHEIITDNYLILIDEHQRTHHHGSYNNPYPTQDPSRYHSHSQTTQQCMKGPFGEQVCGFNCLRSINRVACARMPDQQCVADSFGHISCGYGCVKSPLKVACAQRRDENCVINSFNEIACGRHCRIDHFNHIQCDNN
ncbi:TPA: DM9 repeat-containing protein [Legionella feeleii]